MVAPELKKVGWITVVKQMKSEKVVFRIPAVGRRRSAASGVPNNYEKERVNFGFTLTRGGSRQRLDRVRLVYELQGTLKDLRRAKILLGCLLSGEVTGLSLAPSSWDSLSRLGANESVLK